MQVYGLRCISILRFLTDHISVLSLGVLARLVTTHDTPGLVAALVQQQPWTRETRDGRREVWRDGEWAGQLEPAGLEKMEAQAWICLYNLLSCQEIMEKYQLNDFRISVLSRVQGRLSEQLLDQLPILSHLQRWLAQVTISRPPPAKPSLVLELVPHIRHLEFTKDQTL